MSTAKSTVASLKVGMRALVLILIVVSTISYFVSLVLGPVLFFSSSDGLTAAQQRIHGIDVGLFMIFSVPIPVGVSLGVLFVLIWGVFLACMILAWFDRGGYLSSARGALAKSISLAKTNFLYIMPLVASALLSATIIISSFQESQGVQTGSISFPTTNPYVILTELAFAPLQEEFAFRITSIGLVVGILLLFLYRKDPKTSSLGRKGKLILLAMFSPELAKAKMGYRNVRADGFPRGISPVEWVLILLTSLVFGLAHFLAGSGWEAGKVSTAFLAGFVFAIMYVAYGAYASILLHWFFNYYFDVLSIAETAYGGIFQQISNLASYTNLLGGGIILTVFMLATAFRLGNYFANRASGQAGRTQSIE
jgi:membrane protease YdiL (CAAX protease family)